jgi:proline-specific peptidase
LDPFPAELWTTFEAPDVYGTMWGPSEFCFVGNLSDWDRVDHLHEITVPTLITVGRYDELTPACSEQIHERIPGSRLVVFEESAHWTHWDEADRYLQVVDDFLRSV